MGNCALKPKVLMAAGAPAPEELQISFLEDEKVDAAAAKSLSNLFLQDKAEKKTKEEEKVTPEKIPVIEDLKTALSEVNSPTKETKSPATETKPLITETQSPLTETNAPADDQKVNNEETVGEEKVIDDVTVKETETEAKPDEVRREAAAP